MSDDLSGRTLGRYQVLERLGRGGMAEVYRAYQPSLDRYVAIKVIYPHLASDPALLERFGREARAVAALHHPNIVQVHDFDVQSGSAFMAMEFISGPTLKAVIQTLHERGRLLPLPVVGQIIGQLADALGYAHEQRVIHRDVKPANVLIRRRNPADTPLTPTEIDALLLDIGPTSVVLTDFGVARMIKDSVEHTAAGTILGSPAYMSPEQGRGERVGPGSDIYSLGIVLYELLTGRVPFDADTPFAIVIKHSTAPLPPPRHVRPDLPTPVEQVLLKALAKDPQDRFADAAAFGVAVREATASSAPTGFFTQAPSGNPRPAPDPRETRVVEMTEVPPTPTHITLPQSAPEPQPVPPPATSAPAPRRTCLRTSLTILAVATVLVVAVIGAFMAGGALVFRGLFGSDTAANMDKVIAMALSSGHAACSGPGCPGGNPEKALAIYNTALALQPNSAALLASRALLYVWWDPYTYANQAHVDITSALSYDKTNAVAYLARASLSAVTAQDSAARAEALDAFNTAIKLDPSLTVAYLERARFRFSAPDFYDQTSPNRDAVITDTSEVIAREPTNGVALNLRAEAYYNSSRPDESLADTNAALAINPKDFESLLRRGRLNRYHYPQPDAALADFATAIAVNPQNSDAREGHAAMLVRTDNYQAALVDAQVMVAADTNNASAATFRGFVLLALDRIPEAQQDFDRALVTSPNDLSARYGRGLVLLAQDKPTEAIPDLEVAAQNSDALNYVQEVFTYGRSRAPIDLARAYLAVGRQSDAGPLLDAAVRQYENWYLPYLVRSRYRRAMNDIAGAREDLHRADANAASPAERAEVAHEQEGQ
ncbi:MAG: protein kinase [Chloroflexales bacterium]